MDRHDEILAVAAEVDRGDPRQVSADACRGARSCAVNFGAVGKGSCACELAGPNEIARNACVGDRACFNAEGPISAGTCNGPPDPVTGKGVCER